MIYVWVVADHTICGFTPEGGGPDPDTDWVATGLNGNFQVFYVEDAEDLKADLPDLPADTRWVIFSDGANADGIKSVFTELEEGVRDRLAAACIFDQLSISREGKWLHYPSGASFPDRDFFKNYGRLALDEVNSLAPRAVNTPPPGLNPSVPATGWFGSEQGDNQNDGDDHDGDVDVP